MRKLLNIFSIVAVSLTLLAMPYQAEAKRLGFGKSFGKQYSMPAPRKSTSTLPPSTATQAAAGRTAPKSGASRWLGPLAGLAAGGLLASLFFGDAFEGFQIMDFLLIAALVFGVMMLLRAMRSRPSPYQLRSAGGPNLADDFQVNESPMGSATAAVDQQEGGYASPAWFESVGFTDGAKVHFIRLQAAWDKGDMKDIAEYTTPELFAQLQAERLNAGTAENFTEVVSLDAELVHCRRDGDNVVASVRFGGMIREERDAEPQAFSEIWHVIHAWDRAEGDWFVAGIQQVDA